MSQARTRQRAEALARSLLRSEPRRAFLSYAIIVSLLWLSLLLRPFTTIADAIAIASFVITATATAVDIMFLFLFWFMLMMVMMMMMTVLIRIILL